jgi:hypothetical protein
LAPSNKARIRAEVPWPGRGRHLAGIGRGIRTLSDAAGSPVGAAVSPRVGPAPGRLRLPRNIPCGLTHSSLKLLQPLQAFRADDELVLLVLLNVVGGVAERHPVGHL